MSYHIIETEKDIEEGVRALRKNCPHMRTAIRDAGPPPLRRISNDFRSLAQIIASQQLSVASASAIWGRLCQHLPDMTARNFLVLDDDALRAVGLSKGKVKTLRALATAAENDEVDFIMFADMEENDIRARLTSVHGIGPWTADIYILFCLGRADGFAPGDLALQKAAQMLIGLADKPKPATLLELAEAWRPWRGVAARQLWHYYAWRQHRAVTPV